MLIESYELNRKFCHEPQGNPFVQPHSFPFDVRHNLLSSKESVSSSYKAAYPFVLRLEFSAVQIIAVDTVRKSGSHKAGYLSKAGHPIQNTDSTGDLNRGRRACPACFLCYFLHAAKSNISSPFRELSIAWKARPCRGSTLRVLLLPFSLKHGRLAHIRSQFSLFRRSPTHKNLPLAIFCTSEQGDSRFYKP